MATGNPDPVEVWAPLFLLYGGGPAPKFKKEQVLDPNFAIVFGHCKLCDDMVVGSVKEHMKAHSKDLTRWLGRRRKESAERSKAGLAAARRERQMLSAKAEADAIIKEEMA